MLRILHGTSYDFIRWWRWAAGLTIAFIVIGAASILHKEPNFSIEFTGGTLMQVQFATPPDVGAIRSSLDQAGIKGAEIQQFGTSRDFTVTARISTTFAVALDTTHASASRFFFPAPASAEVVFPRTSAP